MNDVKQIEAIIEDANDNYDNGRIDDAYQHYSIISQKFMENEKLEELLYFSYRALVCLKQLDRDKERVKQILKLGTKLIRFGLSQTKTMIKEKRNPLDKVQLYQYQKQTIENVNFTEYLSTVNNEIVDGLDQLSQEIDLTRSERINYLQRIIDFTKKNNLDRELANYQDELIELLIEQAKEINTDEINIFSKIQTYKETLEILDENDFRYEKIKNKVNELVKISESY